MNYKDFKTIKERIEVFEDASFVSLQGDSELLLKSSNYDLWSVPFSFENNQLTLFGKKAVLVEEKQKIVEEVQNLNEINALILEASSNKDEETYFEGMNRLVDVFLEERKKKKIKKKAMNSMYESEENEVEDEENILWENQSATAQEFTKEFISYWEDKLDIIKSNFNELFSVGFLFDENHEFKKETILDPIMVLENYKNKQTKVKNFFEELSVVDEWYLKAEELGIMKESLEGISPLSKDWKIALFKNLVLQKRKGYDLPIHETLKQLEDFSNEIISEADMTMNIGLNSEKVPGSHNGENKMNFLKINGTFTPTDLEKLVSDFTRAMATYQASGFDRDTLGKVSNYKDMVDKMYRTNMIDDETVSKIITDFNSNFGPVKDSIYSPLMSFKSGSVY
jgi:hypothetical protein